MAKKRSKTKQPAAASDAAPLRNAAFAGLAGLRDALPEADPASPQGALNMMPPPSEPAPPHVHARTNDDLPTPRGKVVLRRERKGRGGKTVTRIAGLADSEKAAASWCKRLKRELGCGGTVEGEHVVLLGDVGDRAEVALGAAGVTNVIRGN